MLPNRCLIVASGNSLSEGLMNGLSNYFDTEVCFSLNDNIRFFDTTVAMVGDWTAYADRYDYFKSHPLVIGKYDCHFENKIEGARYCPKQEGLILLKSSGAYHGEEGLSKGLYSAKLTGMFALNLAIRLGFKQIFLLGFDAVAINGKTHWYQDVDKEAGQFTDYEGKPYTGVGLDENNNYRTSLYNNSDEAINKDWEPFLQEKVKIYNVSLESRINVFEKIGYCSFLKILKENPLQINQSEIQKEIRIILEPYNLARKINDRQTF